MNLLSDIITYVRRLIKSPSTTQMTDKLIIDYINRFWVMDVDARIQLFDLKTSYSFQTIPGIGNYNMPLYSVQSSASQDDIKWYPVYQGFEMPAYVNGIQIPFYTQPTSFWNLWPNYVQFLNPADTGDDSTGTYTINLAEFPAIPGYLDMTGIIAAGNNPVIDPIFTTTFPASKSTPLIPYSSIYPGVHFTATDQSGNNMWVQDSGLFLSGDTGGDLIGLLITQTPTGNSYETPYPFNYQFYNSYTSTLNVVNYTTGVAYVTFPNPVPDGNDINAESLFFQPGLPRAALFSNNNLTIRPQPDISYNVYLTAYLTPAAFLNTTQAVEFAYMSEYIARGAARKILADTGDTEQFMFYEPLFKEQETLVWKRSQRQFTASRTATIFSDLQGQTNFNQLGASN